MCSEERVPPAGLSGVTGATSCCSLGPHLVHSIAATGSPSPAPRVENPLEPKCLYPCHPHESPQRADSQPGRGPVPVTLVRGEKREGWGLPKLMPPTGFTRLPARGRALPTRVREDQPDRELPAPVLPCDKGEELV